MQKLYSLRVYFNSGLISRIDFSYEKSAIKNAVFRSKHSDVLGCEISFNGNFHSMYKNGKLL